MTRKRIPDNCPEIGSLRHIHIRQTWRKPPLRADLWKIFHKSAAPAESEHSGALRVGLDVEDLVPSAPDLNFIASHGRRR